jgi:hypothetical protein
MDARHRIRIIAAAAAVAALTAGRATAQEEPIPATELGRAVRECIDSDASEGDVEFYDDGLSVRLDPVRSDNEEECVLRTIRLPEWLSHIDFVGVLKFGDWSVMRGSSGSGVGTNELLIMVNEVAPDN